MKYVDVMYLNVFFNELLLLLEIIIIIYLKHTY